MKTRMKNRNSIHENDDNQKSNVLHDVHDDDNHDIVDDDENGNQVHEDTKSVYTVADRNKNSARLFVIITTMKK